MKKNLCAFGIISLTLLSFTCKKKEEASAGTVQRKVFYGWQKFSMGVDLSYVNQVEDYGGVYKDSGKVRDLFLIMKEHGANTVRVRLWHTPQWVAALNN